MSVSQSARPPDDMSWEIRQGDALDQLREMPSESVQCCVTSPPYFGLRDYGQTGQIGLEATPDEYVAKLVEVFREVRRVLRADGTLWLNIGDSYAARQRQSGDKYAGALTRASRGVRTTLVRPVPPRTKEKDLIGIPWLVAFALRADGWYLRSDVIWHKPNPMPESVTDRPTRAHEYLFLLSRSPRYFYDADAIREPLAAATIKRDQSPRGRSQNGGGSSQSRAGYDYSRDNLGNMSSNVRGSNRRTVWTVTTQPYAGAHFATFPPKLIEPCILACAHEGGTVLDPFAGSGTTGMMALRHNRSFVGVELNPDYCELARSRIRDDAPLSNTLAEAA